MGKSSARKHERKSTRLADRILARKAKTLVGRMNTSFYDAIEHARVLDIGNVAEFFYERAEAEPWKISDFPNIAPPFETFFAEFDCSSYIRSDVSGLRPLALGALVESERLDPKRSYKESFADREAIEFVRNLGGNLRRDMIPRRERIVTSQDACWHMRMTLCVETDSFSDIFVAGESAMFVRHDGSHHAIDDQENALPFQMYATQEHYATTEQLQLQITTYHRNLVLPVLFAISLMHCKNVEAIERARDERASRCYRERHGRDLVRVSTLTIEPMKRVLKAEAGGQTGLKHALNICRGHFKTYTKERPLFGRVAGTFWTPQHARGDRSRGTIVHDDIEIKMRKGEAESKNGAETT